MKLKNTTHKELASHGVRIRNTENGFVVTASRTRTPDGQTWSQSAESVSHAEHIATQFVRSILI
jgi:NADP-dependent 3-hydroxy acid dehydrogenase YdfG